MSTLFKQLHALVCQSDGGLVLSIVPGKAGKMTVAVMPKSNQKEASESGLLTPLALTGTPEELDAEFLRCLGEFTGQRQSLVDQLAATTAALEAAKGKAVAKAKPAGKPAALPAPTAQAGVTSASDLIEADEESDEPVSAAPEAAQSGSTGSLFGNAALVG